MFAPLRAEWLTAGDEGADAALCAMIGALVIDTASAAANVAFLKLMSNSRLSWPLMQCHSAFRLTTPNLAVLAEGAEGVAHPQRPAASSAAKRLRRGRD